MRTAMLPSLLRSGTCLDICESLWSLALIGSSIYVGFCSRITADMHMSYCPERSCEPHRLICV